jgi:hypothetical protein
MIVSSINLSQTGIYRTQSMKNNPLKQSLTAPARIPQFPLPSLSRFPLPADRTNNSNTINIKELNAQTKSIIHLDFGERSLRYQNLLKGIKAPSPDSTPEEISISDEEREFVIKAARDISSALGSMKVKDVGQVVVGFDL